MTRWDASKAKVDIFSKLALQTANSALEDRAFATKRRLPTYRSDHIICGAR